MDTRDITAVGILQVIFIMGLLMLNRLHHPDMR